VCERESKHPVCRSDHLQQYMSECSAPGFGKISHTQASGELVLSGGRGYREGTHATTREKLGKCGSVHDHYAALKESFYLHRCCILTASTPHRSIFPPAHTHTAYCCTQGCARGQHRLTIHDYSWRSLRYQNISRNGLPGV